MFDLRDVWLYLAMILPAALVVLPIQLLLCFRLKKLAVKLIPTVLLIVAFVVFVFLKLNSMDWDALAYGIAAVYIGVWLVIDLLAWIIWTIIYFVKMKKNKQVE